MGTVTGVLFFTQRSLRQFGFTLIELLLVIAIAGITLGLISLNFGPDQRQSLQVEAQRLALLMEVASDEAILRNRPILFQADSQRYQFLIRTKGSWAPIKDDELLRGRNFSVLPLTLRVTPDENEGDVRILFDPQPLGKSFALTMSSGDAAVGIHADGLGRYVVQ